MSEPSHYSLPAEASVATPTHVPRAWYESQRAALHRAEGRAEALLAEITRLHKQIDGGQHSTPSPTSEAPGHFAHADKSRAKLRGFAGAPKPQDKVKPKRPELEISF